MSERSNNITMDKIMEAAVASKGDGVVAATAVVEDSKTASLAQIDSPHHNASKGAATETEEALVLSVDKEKIPDHTARKMSYIPVFKDQCRSTVILDPQFVQELQNIVLEEEEGEADIMEPANGGTTVMNEAQRDNENKVATRIEKESTTQLALGRDESSARESLYEC